MESEPDLSALSYEIKDNVAVWHIKDFETLFEEEMDEGEQLYLEKSGGDEITATVVRFDGAPRLGSEEQSHINEVWSQLAQSVDIDRAAYVGEGIAAMAVESNVEAPGVDVESFSDREAAIEWAQNGE